MYFIKKKILLNYFIRFIFKNQDVQQLKFLSEKNLHLENIVEKNKKDFEEKLRIRDEEIQMQRNEFKEKLLCVEKELLKKNQELKK